MASALQTVDFDHKKKFLHKQACFSQLNDTETSELASMLKEKRIIAGETIVTEGDLVDSVYLIVNGKAEVRKQFLNNDEFETKTVAELNIGAAIGLNETGFFSLSGRRTATVVALTDMVVLQLNVAAFHGFALAHSRVNSIMRQQAMKFLKATKVYE